MGTRGTVTVMDYGKPLVTVYRQYDCYPSGLGEDVKRILNDGEVEIINGISGNQNNPSHFNGMGCLAAYLISQMKDGIGGCYIMPIGDRESYNYTLWAEDGDLYMKVEDYDSVLWSGPLEDFDSDDLSGDDD